MANKERPQNKNLEKGKATQFKAGDKQKKIARQGGLASAKAKKEKSDFKKKCQIWMETAVAKDKDGKPMTGADLMIEVAGKEIKNGSAKFWELMRDTAGYKPVDKIMVAEVDQEVIDEVEAMVLGLDEENGKKDEA